MDTGTVEAKVEAEPKVEVTITGESDPLQPETVTNPSLIEAVEQSKVTPSVTPAPACLPEPALPESAPEQLPEILPEIPPPPPRKVAAVPDLQVKAGSKRISFTENAFIWTQKKFGSKGSKESLEWGDIQNVSVEWNCFCGGTLILKDMKGANYKFHMGKTPLLKVAAGVRRMKERQPKPHILPLAVKVRLLLENHEEVYASNSGLVAKRRHGCFISKPSYIPWSSIVSTRVDTDCTGGKVTINAISQSEAAQPNKRRSRTELQIDVDDDDDTSFSIDTTHQTIIIKTGIPTARLLHDYLTSIMSDNFAKMEELPNVHIYNKSYHAKATQSGMFLHSAVGRWGGGVTKAFIPWSSMVSMTHIPNHRKKGQFLIHDRSEVPLDLGDVSTENFETVRDSFSNAVVEGVPVHEPDAGPPSTLSSKKGLCPGPSGIFDVVETKGLKKQLFIPWSRMDGLVLTTGQQCSPGAMYLVTETGLCYKIEESRKMDVLWGVFDKAHDLKYGHNTATYERVFNKKDDPRFSCRLTDQSLRLCYKKGKVVVELDLERVITAHQGKRGTKVLEIATSMGQMNKSTIISLELNKDDDAMDIAEEIQSRAVSRKKSLLTLM